MLKLDLEMGVCLFTGKLVRTRCKLKLDSKDVLLFLGVIAELNPLVIVEDESLYLDVIGDLFSCLRSDRYPSKCRFLCHSLVSVDSWLESFLVCNYDDEFSSQPLSDLFVCLTINSKLWVAFHKFNSKHLSNI